jgi:preprotein translocase YajC subunit
MSDPLLLLAQSQPGSAPAPVETPAPAPAAPATTSATEAPGAPQPGGPTAPARDPGRESMSMFLMMGVIFAIFYFILIRPQRKRERERLALLDKIQKNDRVLTSGGMFGTVHSVKNNEVILKIDEDKDVKIRVTKGSIMHVETETESARK